MRWGGEAGGRGGGSPGRKFETCVRHGVRNGAHADTRGKGEGRGEEEEDGEGRARREREEGRRRRKGCFASTGGGKEEMGHIKGSLGHGGWYLTQIHIFHSDGRGTMERGAAG